MTNQTPSETASVTYSVSEPVKVDGIDIAPGSYTGTRVRLGMHGQGGTVRWEQWEYRIDPPGFGNLDCTAQVKDGSIKVTSP